MDVDEWDLADFEVLEQAVEGAAVGGGRRLSEEARFRSLGLQAGQVVAEQIVSEHQVRMSGEIRLSLEPATRRQRPNTEIAADPFLGTQLREA